MSNLRKLIDNDYFKYRDIFYRCLAANLAIHCLTVKNIRSNTLLEDAHYNQQFNTMLEGSPSIEYIIRDMSTQEQSGILVDINLYLSSFLQKHYSENLLNIFSVSIEDNFHLKILNKQVMRGQPVYVSLTGE